MLTARSWRVSQIEQLGPLPSVEHIVKLSGQATGDGGFVVWRGRVRGGSERSLTGSWVRSNFKPKFVELVRSQAGAFVFVPTGRAQVRPVPPGQWP